MMVRHGVFCSFGFLLVSTACVACSRWGASPLYALSSRASSELITVWASLVGKLLACVVAMLVGSAVASLWMALQGELDPTKLVFVRSILFLAFSAAELLCHKFLPSLITMQLILLLCWSLRLGCRSARCNSVGEASRMVKVRGNSWKPVRLMFLI